MALFSVPWPGVTFYLGRRPSTVASWGWWWRDCSSSLWPTQARSPSDLPAGVLLLCSQNQRRGASPSLPPTTGHWPENTFSKFRCPHQPFCASVSSLPPAWASSVSADLKVTLEGRLPHPARGGLQLLCQRSRRGLSLSPCGQGPRARPASPILNVEGALSGTTFCHTLPTTGPHNA